jgi:hypothetical protein
MCPKGQTKSSATRHSFEYEDKNNLVVDKRNLLRDTLFHQLELELQVLAREHGVIIFFHVRRNTGLLRGHYTR